MLDKAKNPKRLKLQINSDTYNRLAELALGIAEQESKFGTNRRYKLKKVANFLLGANPDKDDNSVKNLKYNTLKGRQYVSRGITQVKVEGDNKELRNLYKEAGLNTYKIQDDIQASAMATMLKLIYIYSQETGTKYYDNKGQLMDRFDVLLYRYNGRGEAPKRTAEEGIRAGKQYDRPVRLVKRNTYISGADVGGRHPQYDPATTTYEVADGETYNGKYGASPWDNVYLNNVKKYASAYNLYSKI